MRIISKIKEENSRKKPKEYDENISVKRPIISAINKVLQYAG